METMKILTCAKNGFIDDVKNPTMKQVQEAFNNLNPKNTDMDLGVGKGNKLYIAIDITGTRYVVSLGEFYSGKRVIDPNLINRDDVYARQPLEFYAQNGEAFSCAFKQSVSKEEAERVLLYFYEHGTLPDDVTLL